jgi:aryl carrier-like protein
MAAGDTTTLSAPFRQTSLHILDAALNRLPAGAEGELCIGGLGLARGYLKDPRQTADVFVPDPYSTLPGARLYRTGDRARWLPNGDLKILGRKDQQIKLNGLRIEAGEIEAALAEINGIEDIAVVQDPNSISSDLVAVIVAPTIDERDTRLLIRQASRLLPKYMVPARFIFRNTLPLTSNGKTDRARISGEIPAPQPDRPEYEAPRPGIEEMLAQIWQDVLQIRKVSRHDSFLAMGGNSMRALQVVYRCKQAGLGLTLQHLSTLHTIAELAAALQVPAANPALPAERTNAFDLLSDEDRMRLSQGVAESTVGENA